MAKFYITTSIAYANAKPHIGFALESIQADVLARYHRTEGDDVFFLTGTDEHGTKNYKTARESKKDPQDFVDENSKKFQELTEKLSISNDYFIRTSDQKKHWPTVIKFWKQLDEKGDIYKKKYAGKYCSGCEAFVLEKDIKNNQCQIHQRELETVEEENYFFRLSKYTDRLKKIYQEDKLEIVPRSRKREVLSILDDIDDLSVSRSREKLPWGIPVPGDETQTIYVWVDALSNYISGADNSYWPADVHCIGKDILKFHAIYWPAILLSLEIALPKALFVHGFITADGQKMSKSLGNVIDPFELIKKYGVDAVRYYLLREISPTEDGDFSLERFKERYNSDLASGIGNLVSRVITMARNRGFEDARIPKIDKAIEITHKKYKEALAHYRFNDALIEIWKLISTCDKIIEKERPWEGSSPKTLGALLDTIDKIADLLSPFLPETSEKIRKEVERSNKLKNKKKENLFERL